MKRVLCGEMGALVQWRAWAHLCGAGTGSCGHLWRQAAFPPQPCRLARPVAAEKVSVKVRQLVDERREDVWRQRRTEHERIEGRVGHDPLEASRTGGVAPVESGMYVCSVERAAARGPHHGRVPVVDARAPAWPIDTRACRVHLCVTERACTVRRATGRANTHTAVWRAWACV